MFVAITVLLSLLGGSGVPEALALSPCGLPIRFKIMYLTQDGQIVRGNVSQGNSLKVVGSPLTSLGTLDYAANEIHKMLRLSPPHIFTNLASHQSGIGIFTQQEKLTVFPEYAHLSDTPECQGTCAGSCNVTCTFDGRKWDTVPGAGGIIAVVHQDNVMCTASDPYRHQHNILITEFAHIVRAYGFSSVESQQNIDNYDHARANRLWRLSSYAMVSSGEYFAESTGAFFAVNRQDSAGGMNECGGPYVYCTSEREARYHIYQTDVQLYNLLVQVYTNDRATQPSGLTVCPPNI